MLFNIMKPDQPDDDEDDKMDKNFMKQISGQEKKLTKESQNIKMSSTKKSIPSIEAEVLRNKIKFISKMVKFNKTIR